jgi:hypothetical protein
MNTPENPREREKLIEALVDREMQRLAPARDAAAAQLHLLGERLLAVLGEDAIPIENGRLMVERERAGRREWTYVDESTGEPIGRWQLAAPPRARSALTEPDTFAVEAAEQAKLN